MFRPTHRSRATCLLWSGQRPLTKWSAAAEHLFTLCASSHRDFANLVFGHMYTIAFSATAYDRTVLGLCNVETMLPENRGRCEVPEIGIPALSNATIWLAYAQWYGGDRAGPVYASAVPMPPTDGRYPTRTRVPAAFATGMCAKATTIAGTTWTRLQCATAPTAGACTTT